ncbi:hypothetical protein JAO76_02390 [Pontibacter sp. BT310]|jgi:hypothetical protein|uniref:Uncharacterized protein n=1 Tax=Pontibacter populi TaxID=890055 RepID=A0ABS6X9K7_9BACT|nr:MULTISPECIES: hypothetical protein [Pontibacter]MBJ6117022.1 hypothetical protein [Pontibacter sp. BT310]MBR0569446.1 hypothetical protein [Microvirga sp. STS03]MBW3363875.1 hypothetical protein [Pontibacter populi]
MNKKIYAIAAAFITSTMLLASCGETGENSDMPPESTTGNTQETGVEGSGDMPGTGADDSTQYMNEAIGDDNASSGDSIK